MKDKRKNGIGMKFALNGLKEAFLRERNFRIHLYIALIIVIISFYFKLSNIEWMFIISMISLVLLSELINSLIERLIDYLKPEIHPQAKIIKDISAAVVLISAITSVVIGFIIFIPKIF
ncbi:diacylglycerol kinase family protein [Pseudogracilibacillus sp. SE30717A]|uniref:diacylglycerol kinase family protein n=1 Tax=Pseudogracilibacillus sp. SE30717A TaxID=3098293 RepID=UPI00300E0B11